jgi:anaerobic ribonucleoside-triphosphate reductase activating protein
MTPEARNFRPERAVSVNDLADRIVLCFALKPAAATGLTVSGGEPFDQPGPLLELLRVVNDRGVRDVLLYSGYRSEELLERHPDLPGLAAALVDGPFERGSATNAPWKGSENQRLHLWRPEFESRYRAWARCATRRLQLATDREGRKYLIGIPGQHDAEKLKTLKTP